MLSINSGKQKITNDIMTREWKYITFPLLKKIINDYNKLEENKPISTTTTLDSTSSKYNSLDFRFIEISNPTQKNTFLYTDSSGNCCKQAIEIPGGSVIFTQLPTGKISVTYYGISQAIISPFNYINITEIENEHTIKESIGDRVFIKNLIHTKMTDQFWPHQLTDKKLRKLVERGLTLTESDQPFFSSWEAAQWGFAKNINFWVPLLLGIIASIIAADFFTNCFNFIKQLVNLFG